MRTMSNKGANIIGWSERWEAFGARVQYEMHFTTDSSAKIELGEAIMVWNCRGARATKEPIAHIMIVERMELRGGYIYIKAVSEFEDPDHPLLAFSPNEILQAIEDIEAIMTQNEDTL